MPEAMGQMAGTALFQKNSFVVQLIRSHFCAGLRCFAFAGHAAGF